MKGVMLLVILMMAVMMLLVLLSVEPLLMMEGEEILQTKLPQKRVRLNLLT
jgi:hypothetical protein